MQLLAVFVVVLVGTLVIRNAFQFNEFDLENMAWELKNSPATFVFSEGILSLAVLSSCMLCLFVTKGIFRVCISKFESPRKKIA